MPQALPEHIVKALHATPKQAEPPKATQDETPPSITATAPVKKSDNVYTSAEEFEQTLAQKHSLEHAYKILLLSLGHAFGQENIVLPKFKAEKEFAPFPGGPDDLDIFHILALRLKPLTSDNGVTRYLSRINETQIHVSANKIEYAGLKGKKFTMGDAYDMAFAAIYNSNFGSPDAPLIIDGSLTQRRMLENAIDEINELLPEEHRKHIGNRVDKMWNVPKGNLSQYFERALALQEIVQAETTEALQKIVTSSSEPTKDRRFAFTTSTRANVDSKKADGQPPSHAMTSTSCFSEAVANSKETPIAESKVATERPIPPQTAEAGPA